MASKTERPAIYWELALGFTEGERKLGYVEITHPLTEGNAADVEFKPTMKGADGTERKFNDRHSFGVFPRATWLQLLRDAGFRVRTITDAWERECFICKRAQA